MESLYYLLVVTYQKTLTRQALNDCFPSKESMSKRAICHYPNAKLSVRLTKTFNDDVKIS